MNPPHSPSTFVNVAIIGSGPAALMAADVLSQSGHSVELFEKRKSAGRKLLVAGSSGLNISNSLPRDQFIAHYTGPREFWRQVIDAFPPQAWIQFIEGLGISTFEGTSGRYFIEDMKASRFLQTWIARLSAQGVKFHFGYEFSALRLPEADTHGAILFANGEEREFQAACFALGGASWEPQETPLHWPPIFKKIGIDFDDFTASNVGYRVAWPSELLKEAEGLPLKRIVLSSAKATREGDAMVTAYGIEGTPVYFAGQTGIAHLDLKPDLSVRQILDKLRAVKENLSPMRRIKKQLNLCPASLAVLFHLTPPAILKDPSLEKLAAMIKSFPLTLLGPQPITEAISSAGGIRLSEIDQNFMLRKIPGVFAAGEMLSWDVPTGGFLLQGCVAQGFLAAKGVITYLQSKKTTDSAAKSHLDRQ